MNQENSKKWGRKQKVNIITLIFLLAGFCVAGWMHMDFQLYLCYAAGCTGANLGFIYGNAKEYEFNQGRSLSE